MTDPFPLLDLLDDRIDDLSAALQPLLSQTIQDSANTLPVADKARLYVLTTYALESLLFTYLRMHLPSVQSHAIMRELQRVRQYVSKIRTAAPSATFPAPAPALTLDRAAAGRFIAAALAGNEAYDLERAATQAGEKATAAARLAALGPATHEVQRGPRRHEEDEEGPELKVHLCVEDGGVGEQAAKKQKQPRRKKTKLTAKEKAACKEKKKDTRKGNKAASSA